VISDRIAYSVVVPAYRQAMTIAEDLAQLTGVLEMLDGTYEVIVVVDGRIDDTAARARALNHPCVRVVEYERNSGKGYALRHGFLLAKGELVAFIDAGMDIDPHALLEAVSVQRDSGSDIVIGSKRHPKSRVAYPFIRRLYSLGYQVLIKILFNINVRDTQVGMKLFHHKVINKVTPRLVVKKFAFDIEMLVVARLLGFVKIAEIPVTINHINFASTIRFRSVIEVLWDTMAVWYRARVLQYYTANRWGDGRAVGGGLSVSADEGVSAGGAH